MCAVAACSPGPVGRDEVVRLASPDGELEGVVIEVGGGATTSFAYEIHVLPAGTAPDGAPDARLYGATRNDSAFGVDLRWQDRQTLLAEYFQARSIQPAAGPVRVDGRTIELRLVADVRNPSAPAGGMARAARQEPGNNGHHDNTDH